MDRMSPTNGVVDTGLFRKESKAGPGYIDSYDSIIQLMHTVHEYRMYASPDKNSWHEYTREVFHLFGFDTVQRESRILTISEFGAKNTINATVALVKPEEHFEELLPGFQWVTFLQWINHYHNIRWGIVTNGMQYQLVDFQRRDFNSVYFRFDLDMILHNKLESQFFTVFRAIQLFRNSHKADSNIPTKKSKRTKTIKPGDYTLEWHTARKQPEIVNMFNRIRQEVLNLSEAVIEKPNKLYIAYSTRKNFFTIRIQTQQLKIWLPITVDELPGDIPYYYKDVTNIGHWGTGKTVIIIRKPSEIDALLQAIHLSYAKSL